MHEFAPFSMQMLAVYGLLTDEADPRSRRLRAGGLRGISMSDASPGSVRRAGLC